MAPGTTRFRGRSATPPGTPLGGRSMAAPSEASLINKALTFSPMSSRGDPEGGELPGAEEEAAAAAPPSRTKDRLAGSMVPSPDRIPRDAHGVEIELLVRQLTKAESAADTAMAAHRDEARKVETLEKEIADLRETNARAHAEVDELRRTVHDLRLSTLDLQVEPLRHSDLDVGLDVGLGLVAGGGEQPSSPEVGGTAEATDAAVVLSSANLPAAATTTAAAASSSSSSSSSSSPSSSSAPSGVDIAVVFSSPQLGINFSRVSGKFVVEEATGAAKEHGVRPADAIVVVNGRRLPPDMGNDELVDLLHELPRPLMLGFRRRSHPANPQSSSSRGREAGDGTALSPESREAHFVGSEYRRQYASFGTSDDLLGSGAPI